MSQTDLGRVNEEILSALRPPRPYYYLALLVLAGGSLAFLLTWVYQIRVGMGVAGVNHPVGWAVYIANFVFWVGIAHSGTLISAILYLVRSQWRSAISRSSEAMTIFAIAIAGLFPLIHVGRFWVIYYTMPYPTERQLWPNFTSPLVFDMAAIFTYFNVSVIFFSVGLLPDLAAARDRWLAQYGPLNLRYRIYRLLALGWNGSAEQWRHYDRGYLYFAALATPLVISVHSIVSWDFALSLLSGWHSLIFPPFFVAGAIHSGLAMVLTLSIPMRRLLHLESIIRPAHLEAVAKLMLVTTSIIAYAYVVEPFIAWYSDDIFEKQFNHWRMTGNLAPIYWMLPVLNVAAPLLFAFKRVRKSLPALLVIALLINIGMWTERVHIVIAATGHDFLPHNWGGYFPTWVEITITAGTAAFFFLLFLIFTKSLPVVAMAEVKESLSEGEAEIEDFPRDAGHRISRSETGVLALYPHPSGMAAGLSAMQQSKFDRLTIFSPIKPGSRDPNIGLPRGPVRWWTLIGALLGLAGGLGLAIYTSSVNHLIVGGKHPLAWIAFMVFAFEGMVLVGAYFNLAGTMFHCRLGPPGLPPAYDPSTSSDRFAVFVACAAPEIEKARAALAKTKPEAIRVIGE